ncbi:type IV pilus assembly protein PilY1 [Duganella sp. SG902]|uniref:pilus assembly protein n=1 Tax=Duganella sp. SG902 TaxID=2587016 RepID=UPI00159D5705|nr:PilC/PilY family type IV pilus protein [Duganella sp. SG902]NVM78933.1 type IV pilus assembly protein PilY1 [Duganella sp. SG902]
MRADRLTLLVVLALCAGAASRADVPALEIDSWPVAANCTFTAPAAPAGTARGAMLVRAGPLSAASGGELYQATTDLAGWGGHFSRYLLAASAGGPSTLAWDAGAILTGAAGAPPTPAPERRQIHTSIVQPDGALTVIPFRWSALSAEQQALLDLDDHAGEQRLAYLRGDRTLETTRFRRRRSVLGDTVHSTPVYYRDMVYLGANDGMLHAFDAATGIERFAYVPDALIAHLHHLTDPAYVHRAYVDGPASAGEAGGKSVLVSAMGGGAKGVFALDISDPDNFAGALWEFTDRDDPMMGNLTTVPQIAKVRVRRGVDRYFAVVASGVNNGGDGDGALFLLALDKPRTEGWRRNSNYYRIVTPVAEASLINALSAPVLLNDTEGALRYAYAGDLQGNLWRFDFSGSAPWPKAVGKPLFVARDKEGHRQPITQPPLLAFADVRGYMVMFGTGRLIEKADRSDLATQSYYAILDSLRSPPEVVTGRRQLTQRFLDGTDMRMEPGSKGWYVDFTQPGERSLDTGLLADGAVLFNTVLPGADACATTRSRSYVLNVVSGLPDEGGVVASVPKTLPDYLPTPSLLPQAVTHGVADAAGGIRQEKAYAVVQVVGAGEVGVSGGMTSTRRVGRLAWREIVNWRELHEAAK